MSLITIRDDRDLELFNVISVTVTAVTTTAITRDTLTITDSPSFRRLVVGMTIVDDDSPASVTTTNSIKSIDKDAKKVFINESLPSSTTGTYKFTTATVKGSPLTNLEVDKNFLALEKNKLDSTGNQVVRGNVEILLEGDNPTPNFDTSTGNLFVSEKIIAKTIDIGGTGGTATLTTEGDIEVNNINLNGEIDDRGLFEKYLITKFNNHLLCQDDPTADNTFIVYSVLYLNIINDDLNVGDTITFSSKIATIREKNAIEKYILVEESTLTMDQTYTVGATVRVGSTDFELKKFLRGENLVKADQVIKIFGTGQAAESLPSPPTITKDSDLSTTGTTVYRYKALTLNRLTGKLSSFQSSEGIAISNQAIDQLDETTFNRINAVLPENTAQNPHANLSVLIYREIEGEDAAGFKLVSILDAADFGTNQAVFNDFGDFTINDHANKKEGLYTNVDLEYLPKLYEDRRTNDHLYDSGYQYVRINSVDKTNNKFTVKALTGSGSISLITTDDSPLPTARHLRFYHNNSVAYDNAGKLVGGLQYLINEKSNIGDNIVTLPAGTYHTSMVSLPDNFTLRGESRFGTILKLPPLDDYTNVSTIRGVGAANIVDGMSSDNQKSYANVLVGITQSISDTATDDNISLENLTLDGNYHNRFFSDETTTASLIGDNLVRAEYLKRGLIRGVIIKNSVGGGIYAPGAKNLSVENCDILDNCTELKDTELYSPLYAIAAQDINVTNNRITNGNSAVELSNVVRGSLVGNMVKNTESGVITYASTNFITTPNLVLGPNNELLTTTDSLDSEFDSINVDLLQRVDGDAFESLTITFLKEGEAAHLALANQVDSLSAQIAGTGVALGGTVHALAKQEQFEYFIGGEAGTDIPITNESGINVSATTISFPSSEADRKKGTIKFRMEDSACDVLRDRFSMVRTSGTTLKSQYAALANRPANEQLIGLAYQIHATEYINLVNSNDHIPFVTISRDGSTNNSIVKLGATVDLNNFIVGRKLILSAGTTTNIDSLVTDSVANAKKHITLVTDTPDQYKELTIKEVLPATNEIKVGSDSITLTDVFSLGATVNLSGFNIGFRDKFLIAKGRILI